MNSSRIRWIFFALISSFLVYSVRLYTEGTGIAAESYGLNKAVEGRLVWQRYNCQSCHQLYGLGGFLGPDLTNAYSAPGKGEPVIRAFVLGGSSQMPAFRISEEEMKQLIEFMKMTDASGTADPRSYHIQWDGMISQK